MITPFRNREYLHHLKTPFVFLLLYCVVLLFVRLYLRGHLLELDEAEQVFWASEWQAGYPGQPPLYSWLQYLFFQVFGIHLFSLALLKYGLLFGALYYYHKICQNYCSNALIATAATLSWVLVPTISFDLLKDNTHSILALFLSCLTWYWFDSEKEGRSEWLWYLRLGLVIGCGLLSKFNYCFFLAFLVLSALGLNDNRAKIMNPFFLLSIAVALLVASPYAQWLMIHSHIGFSSLYKIAPPEKNLFHGFVSFALAVGLFAIPLIIITALFFGPIFSKILPINRGSLLLRYHQVALCSLMILLPLFGFTYFETRWLIPIFFLSPLLIFRAIPATPPFEKRAKQFLFLCLLIEIFVLLGLSYRGNFGEHYRQKTAMLAEVKQLANQNPIQTIMADSLLTVGNLRLDKKLAALHLLVLNQWYERPEGMVLICWIGDDKPVWINALLAYYQLTTVSMIQKPGYGLVLSKREVRSR